MQSFFTDRLNPLKAVINSQVCKVREFEFPALNKDKKLESSQSLLQRDTGKTWVLCFGYCRDLELLTRFSFTVCCGINILSVVLSGELVFF